jgi:hypothetical protein
LHAIGYVVEVDLDNAFDLLDGHVETEGTELDVRTIPKRKFNASPLYHRMPPRAIRF